MSKGKGKGQNSDPMAGIKKQEAFLAFMQKRNALQQAERDRKAAEISKKRADFLATIKTVFNVLFTHVGGGQEEVYNAQTAEAALSFPVEWRERFPKVKGTFIIREMIQFPDGKLHFKREIKRYNFA